MMERATVPSPSDTANIRNLYEKTVIIATKARQIVEQRREEFQMELEKMGIAIAEEEQSVENSNWQETLAKVYEEKPSPVETAKKELTEGKLAYTYYDAASETIP